MRYKFTKVEIILFALFSLIGLSLIAVYCCNFWGYGLSSDTTDFGIFGDYVGGVIGTVVSLIGMLFLYRTYILQKSMIELQNKNSEFQLFENRFFELMSIQRDIIYSLTGDIVCKDQNPKSYSGYKYLAELRADLNERFQDANYLYNIDENNFISQKLIDRIFSEFYNTQAKQLGHYYRHIYRLLEYVVKSDNDDETKHTFINYIKAQLSNEELCLIAVNGMSFFGRKRMFPILKKYSLISGIVLGKDSELDSLISQFYGIPNDMNLPPKNVIFVAGIHGVGKTSYITSLQKQFPQLKSLSCSKLINWDKISKNVEDVQENQNYLIDTINKTIDPDEPYLLDGHFCLLNKNYSIENVDISFFEQINFSCIILIYENAEIVVNRLSDRDKMIYDTSFIMNLLKMEENRAKEIASYLNIPLFKTKSSYIEGDISIFIEDFLRTF